MSGAPDSFSLDGEAQRRMDAVVARLTPVRRTFTEEEAFADQWEANYELLPTLDSRFVLAAKADGSRPLHWRLITHTLANNWLLEALTTADWDGIDVDVELARLDAQEGGHHVFCPVDPRFTQGSDGRWEPSDGERDTPLSPEARSALAAYGPRLLAFWKEQGGEPWTVRHIVSAMSELGWAEANERRSWQHVRTWLKEWPQVARVGRDYWVPSDGIPQTPQKTRMQVLPVRTGDGDTAVQRAFTDEETETITEPSPLEMASARTVVTIPGGSGTAGVELSWTTTLRTAHLLEGFIPIPAQCRSGYPPRAPGVSRWETLRGKWFDTDEDLWIWLDREEDRLFGPGLADKLAWCEAGERLRIHWAPDVIVFRSAGVDIRIQEEETRHVDVEALSELRAGLGESYRQSLIATLGAAPQGLTFRELVEAIRERQGHVVHQGTVRAILSASEFVRRDGRWLAPSDLEEGARKLRYAVVQTLIPSGTSTDQACRSSGGLKELAQAIGERLRQIIAVMSQGPREDSTSRDDGT